MAAEASILGVERQPLRFSGGAARASRGMSRLRGIPGLRPRVDRMVSIEPLFLGSSRPSRIVVIDSIRILRNSIASSSKNLGSPSSSCSPSSSRLKKSSLFGLAKKSVARDFSVSASASANPGQTFPSKNGGGEKAKALPLKPDPSVTPEEVVLVQLKALRERNLATVYEFASPANKSHTGPLPRFTQMLEGRAYNLMIGHIDARVLSSMTISPDRFQQRIVITGANGKNATFSWALSKQEEGAHEGCWMTDTVRRDD